MMILGKEREYVVHDDNNIKGFFGEYRYLSNFHEAPVYFDGVLYGSTEAAYQAAKTNDLELRKAFVGMKASDTKKMGRALHVQPYWDDMKYDVMSCVVFDKFYRHLDLREKLLSTGNKYIEETNHWKDVYWGVCDGKGENNLGRVLMAIREYWKAKDKGKSKPLF